MYAAAPSLVDQSLSGHSNRRTCARAHARLRRIYLEVPAANPSPGIRAGVDLVFLPIAEASLRQALTLFCGCVVKVRLIVWQIGFRSTRFSRFQWCRSGPGKGSPLFNCAKASNWRGGSDSIQMCPIYISNDVAMEWNSASSILQSGRQVGYALSSGSTRKQKRFISSISSGKSKTPFPLRTACVPTNGFGD